MEFQKKQDDTKDQNRKTHAIKMTEDKYEFARYLDKERIKDIIAEHADHEQGEDASKLRPLIDEIRLGLCLNYAVFLYEVKNHKKDALRILK